MIAGVASIAAVAVLQFNLVCSMELRTYTPETPLLPLPEPFKHQQTFRIDLASQRWCTGPCDVIKKLTVNESFIGLASELTKLANGNVEGEVSSVNRRTGAYLGISDTEVPQGGFTGLKYVTSGHCEKAPFTEFPEKRF